MPIVLAGMAATVFGVADFLGGTAARRVPSAVVAMLAQLAGLLALGVIMIVLPAEVLPSALGWGLLAGLAGGVGVPLFYRGLAEGSMNVVAPLAALTSAAVPVVAGALFGERPSALAWVGIALAVVAGVVVGLSVPPAELPGSGVAEAGTAAPAVRAADAGTEEPTASAAVSAHAAGDSARVEGGRDRRRAVRGVVLALFSGLCFGGFFVLISRADPAAGLWPVTAAKVAGSLVAGVTLLAALRAGGVLIAWSPALAPGPTSLPAGTPAARHSTGSVAVLDPPADARQASAGWRLAVLGGVLDAAANALYLLAAQRGQLAVVGAIVALYPASTVLLARLLHGERIGPVQRIGLALAVPALILVGAG